MYRKLIEDRVINEDNMNTLVTDIKNYISSINCSSENELFLTLECDGQVKYLDALLAITGKKIIYEIEISTSVIGIIHRFSYQFIENKKNYDFDKIRNFLSILKSSKSYATDNIIVLDGHANLLINSLLD